MYYVRLEFDKVFPNIKTILTFKHAYCDRFVVQVYCLLYFKNADKIVILTGTNYSKCKQKYGFFFSFFNFLLSSGNVGCLTLWSKPVTFTSCSLNRGPFHLGVVGIYPFYDHNNPKQRSSSENAHAPNRKCSKSHFTVPSLRFVSTRRDWRGRGSAPSSVFWGRRNLERPKEAKKTNVCVRACVTTWHKWL